MAVRAAVPYLACDDHRLLPHRAYRKIEAVRIIDLRFVLRAEEEPARGCATIPLMLRLIPLRIAFAALCLAQDALAPLNCTSGLRLELWRNPHCRAVQSR